MNGISTEPTHSLRPLRGAGRGARARQFDPLRYPAAYWQPQRIAPSPWLEHTPFAFALTQMLRPRVVVELSPRPCVAYAAFCQAVQQLSLPTECFAVDTLFGKEIDDASHHLARQAFQEYHDSRYSGFSRSLQMAAQTALQKFADGSVDLLNIHDVLDYNEVKQLWETWSPKLSDRGVLALHGIRSFEAEHGVWRLWAELRLTRPGFEFHHGHGLGVLAAGRACGSAMRALCGSPADFAERIRAHYAALGRGAAAHLYRTNLHAEAFSTTGGKSSSWQRIKRRARRPLGR